MSTTAAANPTGPIQLTARGENDVNRRRTARAASAPAMTTAPRTNTAHAVPASNSSPHHLVLKCPDQMVKDWPLLNEWTNTRMIGTNRNNRTSTVHAARTTRSGSRPPRADRAPREPATIARSWMPLRTRSATGARSPNARGTTHTTAAPTTSVSSTATIIKTAMADPRGQFCAPPNCDAINAPIMLPFAPPSTVAAT